MASQFFADCLICGKKVNNAVLGHGSLESLQKGKGDVWLAHATNDPHVGEHKWKLIDPKDKARLFKLIAEST
jgi:hypothetical protein